MITRGTGVPPWKPTFGSKRLIPWSRADKLGWSWVKDLKHFASCCYFDSVGTQTRQYQTIPKITHFYGCYKPWTYGWLIIVWHGKPFLLGHDPHASWQTDSFSAWCDLIWYRGWSMSFFGGILDGDFVHITSKNNQIYICWRCDIPKWVGWCETLGHLGT